MTSAPAAGVARIPAARGTCPFDPPPLYEQLRDEHSIAPVTLWNDTTAWLVTRHADVRFVLSDDRFSADINRPGFPFLSRAQRALGQAPPTFIRMDAPEHDRLRRMLTAEFTIKRVRAMQPRIQQIVDGFIDDMTAHAPPADLVKEFALPIPSLVICLLLGVPYEDHAFFQRCSSALLNQRSSEAEVTAAQDELRDYLGGLVDASSRLVTEREATGELDREGVVSMARLLLVAGHETTANMTALGVLTLLRNPEQLATLRAEPELIPGAVEELLRYLSIIQSGLPRLARTDVEVGGRLIRAGEGVVVSLQTANRDDERFADPDTLDVRRDGRRHMAFGFGIHQCLGQPLARVELQVALETLIRRVPTLALATDFEKIPFRDTMFIYGVHELPVTW
jgi:cytochrome P450